MDIKSISYPAPGAMAPRSVGLITDFIIHHTAGNPNQTPLEIDAEHRARGMAMIAYNWVITPDGATYEGRPIAYESAATYGRNPESVSVALTGNFQSNDKGYTGPPTVPQIVSLEKLCLYIHVTRPSIARTIGHRDVAPMFYPSNQGDYSTACPGDKLYNLIPEIKKYVMDSHHGRM